MCQTGRVRFGFAGQNDMCGCSCNCPATTTVEEELQLLEDHRKYMQDHLGIIDKKIAALKSTKES
jgi:hypothetical protein